MYGLAFGVKPIQEQVDLVCGGAERARRHSYLRTAHLHRGRWGLLLNDSTEASSYSVAGHAHLKGLKGAVAVGVPLRADDVPFLSPTLSQVTPISGGNWAKYAVALSAPGDASFPVPYTFSLGAGGPFVQSASAYDWGATLTGSRKARHSLRKSKGPLSVPFVYLELRA